MRRCGELLKQYDGRGRPVKNKDGAVLNLSQADAATNARLGERQRKTAGRVANLSDQNFDAAIEGEDPATVTQLAEMGKKTGRAGFKEATHLIGAVKSTRPALRLPLSSARSYIFREVTRD